MNVAGGFRDGDGGRRSVAVRNAFVMLATCAMILLSARTNIWAQSDGHSGHHPTAGEAAPNSGPPANAANGNAPMSGMKQGMGDMMGRPPPKEFFPSLLELPKMSFEQRASIERQAYAWLSEGLDELQVAETALRHANASNDLASAEQASAQLQDAVARARTGVTILRALSAGKSSREIAMGWFRDQLDIAPAETNGAHGSVFGLSWFHVLTMALVAALSTVIGTLQLLRTRRAAALANRLANAVDRTQSPNTKATEISPSSEAKGLYPNIAPTQGRAGAPLGSGPSPIAKAAAESMPRLWRGKLQVAAIFVETPTVKTFRLRNPDGGPIPFTFLPGQFLTFSAEIDGSVVKRSYTIASSAAQTAYVEATIKREETGVFSKFVHDHVDEGDLVEVAAPSGVFTFRGTEAESVVLIGGGVGLTPLMAAVRYLTDIAWPGDIYLVYGARSTEDFIFRAELEYLQSRRRNLHVVATMVRAERTAWMGPEGPITRELLERAVPDIVRRRVHLCGPPQMMQAVKQLLSELGVPAAQVKTEAFGPALGAAPSSAFSPVGLPTSNRAETLGERPALDAAPSLASPTIQFAKSGRSAPLYADQSVLEAAEMAGVHIDYSCRAGVCGICKTKLLEGKVSMEVEDALTDTDRAQNLILACQAKSIGNLTVEA